MEQKKQFDVIFFLIDQERIEKVGHFYRKLRYSQMHSNPGATLKIPLILIWLLLKGVKLFRDLKRGRLKKIPAKNGAKIKNVFK